MKWIEFEFCEHQLHHYKKETPKNANKILMLNLIFNWLVLNVLLPYEAREWKWNQIVSHNLMTYIYIYISVLAVCST